jgi:hypothetical protein
MLACSFAVAAHTLDRSVINYRVASLTWELEELSTSMESVFPPLEDNVRRGKPCQVTVTSSNKENVLITIAQFDPCALSIEYGIPMNM